MRVLLVPVTLAVLTVIARDRRLDLARLADVHEQIDPMAGMSRLQRGSDRAHRRNRRRRRDSRRSEVSLDGIPHERAQFLIGHDSVVAPGSSVTVSTIPTIAASTGAALRRIAVGEFTLESAVSLGELEPRWQRGDVPFIVPEDLLPEFPPALLSEQALHRVRHGMDLEVENDAATVKLMDQTGRLCAIARRVASGLYHPAVVLPEDSSHPPPPGSPSDAMPQHAQSS